MGTSMAEFQSEIKRGMIRAEETASNVNVLRNNMNEIKQNF